MENQLEWHLLLLLPLDKLRSLRRPFADGSHPDADTEASPSKPMPDFTDLKQNQSQSLPVLMPGDQIPKFIALPCPCQPPRQDKVEVKVEKPPKPPHFPVPFGLAT
ncbi:transcription factor bHLH25-like [Hibiscus syriacus]|uniref:Transcription factor bHLH25-like n=1 Tax=Hibiscus syriacus TaxID=106335 RepID=A0A6A3AML8_HIBSY|nr:transcription factor bHLH25-like [Hibiscus syriacus]